MLRSRSLLAAFPLALALSAIQPTVAEAQGDPDITEELVDRIVAVAGDSIILLSQIREQLIGYLAVDPNLENDPNRLREVEGEILENLINSQLIVQAAIKDTTIVIDDARIEQVVDQDLANRTQQLGGEAALLTALRSQGWSMARFREMLRADARRQQLQQQYLAKQQRGMKPIPVMAEEVRRFFEENGDMFGRRPATVTFRQVVIQPTPSDSAEAAALAEARSILDSIRAGSEFEPLARRFSDDDGSRQLDGDLGWFRRPSGFVREFEDAAFALRSGEVSVPIRTQFGYHIIKVDRVRGPERKARHILIGFQVGPEDVQRTVEQAEELKRRIEAGESASALHDEFGSEELPDSLAVPTNDLDRLPSGYAAALRTATAGQVLGPIRFGEGARTNIAVLEVIEVRDEGEFTFEDLEDLIRERLQQEKMLAELVRRVRDAAYVDIR